MIFGFGMVACPAKYSGEVRRMRDHAFIVNREGVVYKEDNPIEK
jgi:hypothetical protein